MPEAGDVCGTCGACCASLIVDFHASCLASRDEGGVPDALTVPVIGNIVRMRGTDAAPPRCCALDGEVGVAVRCTIYEQRPGPCRDFAPYAALGIGDPGCDDARRRHGMPPLSV
ncbi:YkgJ family cysteine cluster protein [Pseudazoarcus pumilus]|uniref:YkgJ family cysteine cluster protein n=1 Tax=Pseudazoarcus pumilus TaxID=2067960 RepID=A0A2I6S870_9RHOO|nr:YkgJ family cysteine cluster protein [Pseudazoarcus pumilus]AUN95470.1 YkgJ family cysteine cluster protein [Pseudazoarcus pumilus]